MAKVRVRKETGKLYLDFFYRGARCREQTTLPDTPENRRRLQALMTRIAKEIKQGFFDYEATFPGSPRATQFIGEGAEALFGTESEPYSPASRKRAPSPTFTEFSQTWRTEMAPQWRRLHRNSVDAIFDAHLLPAFGERAVATITKADALTFRARMAQLPGRTGTTLSPSTINKVVGILRQLMTEASERFGFPDPFKGIKRLKARRPDVQPFTLEEVETIRSSIRPDFCNYVTVRFFTGLRTGEINGLKWKSVDFDKGLILVREVYSAGQVEENAKTESSLRDIPMLPLVRDALLAQRESAEPDNEDGYVFTTRGGNPIDAHNFANRIWYPLLRYLRMDRRRPYQTRHTTATLMLAAGETPEWIARLMGHSNTQMLFTVYSRYVPNLTRQDGLAIAGLISRTQAASSRLATDELNAEQIDSLDADALRKLVKQSLQDAT